MSWSDTDCLTPRELELIMLEFLALKAKDEKARGADNTGLPT
jgi:hypothetical protein